MNYARSATVAVLLSGCLISGPQAAVASPEDALATYRAFVHARDHAESIEALYPFLLSDHVDQLNGLPPDARKRVGDSIINPPNANALRRPERGIEPLSHTHNGEQVTLELEGYNLHGDVREYLSQVVNLVKEEDGWKISDPNPRSWLVTGRIPAAMPATAAAARGPGAVPWTAKFEGETQALSLVAEISVPENETRMRGLLSWDPNGHFLAVGSREGVTFLSLPALETRWATNARIGALASGLLKYDGSALISRGASPATVIPLRVNINRAMPADDYYFFTPNYRAITEDAGSVHVHDVTFHPTRPVLAVASEGRSGHTIYLQPVGDLGSGERSLTLEPLKWALDSQPTALSWSNEGDLLGWVRGHTGIGAEIEIRRYPQGDGQVFSQDPFQPRSLNFSPDGNHLLVLGTANNGYLGVIWNLRSGKTTAQHPLARYGAWAPGSNHLFFVQSVGPFVEEGIDNVIRIARFDNPESITRFEAFPTGDDRYPPQILGLGVSPNGRYLAAAASATDAEGSDRIEVKLWEIRGQR